MLCLKNANGFIAEFSPMGASLHRFLVPDADGSLTNLILTPADPMAPRSECAYAGAIIGPLAGRVRDAEIHVKGHVIHLDANDGNNHLHGGTHGLSDVVWEVKQYDHQQVTFGTFQPDGLGGYPGNRTFEVTYLLNDANTLRIILTAHSDQPTFFNPSTHIYWNLSGDMAESIGQHMLRIPADKVMYNRADHTMEHFESVDGTVFDFRKPKQIGDALKETGDRQIQISRGINHLFAIHKPAEEHNESYVSLLHAPTHRELQVSASLPCQWVYSGGYLDSSGMAVAFEPQHIAQAFDLTGERGHHTLLSKCSERIDFRLLA